MVVDEPGDDVCLLAVRLAEPTGSV
jgi:hypothetical protein